MKKKNPNDKKLSIKYIEDYIYRLNRYEQYLEKVPLNDLQKIEEYLLKSLRIFKQYQELAD